MNENKILALAKKCATQQGYKGEYSGSIYWYFYQKFHNQPLIFIKTYQIDLCLYSEMKDLQKKKLKKKAQLHRQQPDFNVIYV